MQPFPENCGYAAIGFRWNKKRRLLLRCELEAAFFCLSVGKEEE
jgi:hypothetical protein